MAASLQGFISPLPLRAISGVGSKMERALKAMGIEVVADLRSSCTRKALIEQFGSKVGEWQETTIQTKSSGIVLGNNTIVFLVRQCCFEIHKMMGVMIGLMAKQQTILFLFSSKPHNT